MVLRNLTKTTGVLHEAQLLQMKLWPSVLWPRSKTEATISQGSSISTGLVEYDIQVNTPSPSDLENAKTLVDWTKTMLDGWDVRVSVNGKLLAR